MSEKVFNAYIKKNFSQIYYTSDFKFIRGEKFEDNYAKEKDPEVLDRLIPQIYTEDMLGYVMNVHEFKSIDFTLYQIQWDKEEIAKFCGRSGVRFLTVSDELIEDDMIDLWKSMGIKIAVHTVDKEDRANELLDKGVDMIYTNYLEPESQENGESNE